MQLVHALQLAFSSFVQPTGAVYTFHTTKLLSAYQAIPSTGLLQFLPGLWCSKRDVQSPFALMFHTLMPAARVHRSY